LLAFKELGGIHVGGINVSNILYADDTTLIAHAVAKLQKLMLLLWSEWSVHLWQKYVYGYIKIIEHSAL